MKIKALHLLAGTLLVAFFSPLSTQGQGSPTILWSRNNNADRINDVIFNASGDTLISGSSDRLIHFWRTSDGTLLRTLNQGAPAVHESAIESLSITADGTKLASASYKVVKLWTLSSGAVANLNGHSDWVVGVAFSPNAQFLASASFDTTVKIWRVSDGALLRTLPSDRQMRCVAFSPDGNYLVAGGGSGELRLYRTSDWTLVRNFNGHTDDIYTVTFSPDGSRIASGGYDQTARVWNTATGALLYTLNGGGNVYGIAFSPSGGQLIFTDGEGNTLRLHRVSDGAQLKIYTQQVDQVQTVAFSPTGLLGYGRVDKTVLLARIDGISDDSNPPPPPPGPVGENWQLSLEISGNGTVSYSPMPNGPNGTYISGTTVQLTAVPDGNKNSFLGWSGAASGTTRTISITMDSDKTLGASFSSVSQNEFIWQHDDGRMAAWFMDGPSFVGSVLLRNGQPVASGWRLKAVGDLNGDGSSDLLFQHDSGPLTVWFMQGNNPIGSAKLRDGAAVTSWHPFAIADANGDGENDIYFLNDNGTVAVWYMSGPNFVGAGFLRDGARVGAQWTPIGAADLNNDGKTDIVWHRNDGVSAAWIMNGTTFLRSVVIRDGASVGWGWRGVALGDCNKDGRPDLIFQSGDGRLMSWLLNGTTYQNTVLLRDGQPTASVWHLIGVKPN